MGKPILYASEMSPAVRGVLLVAKAMDFDLEIRTVNLWAGEHLKPEFLKMNPQHTVPTLDDNGQILWDSHAIATYLVDKYSKDDSLYPKNLYIRAKVNQRLHFDSSILFPRARPCTEAVFLKGATEFPQSGINEIWSAYDFMEAFLKDDTYFVGNHLTVADLCIGANFSTTQISAPLDTVKYPKLAAWFGKMTKLPYYDEVNGKRNEKYRDFIMGKMEANKLMAVGKK